MENNSIFSTKIIFKLFLSIFFAKSKLLPTFAAALRFPQCDYIIFIVPHPPGGLTAALTLAYKAVMALKVTHQQLVDGYPCVNHNTLRRISQGKKGKILTDLYFLQLFVSILFKEYQRRKADGFEGTETILLTITRIFLCFLLISPDALL